MDSGRTCSLLTCALKRDPTTRTTSTRKMLHQISWNSPKLQTTVAYNWLATLCSSSRQLPSAYAFQTCLFNRQWQFDGVKYCKFMVCLYLSVIMYCIDCSSYGVPRCMCLHSILKLRQVFAYAIVPWSLIFFKVRGPSTERVILCSACTKEPGGVLSIVC